MALRDVQQLLAPRDRLGDAGRVLEVRNRIEELHLLPGRTQRHDRLLQGLRNDALIIHGDMNNLRLVGVEGSQRAYIAGPFGEDDITWIDENAGDKV